MGLRRLISVLSVCVIATGSLVAAAPDKKKAPATKGAAKGSASGSAAGSAAKGSAAGSAAKGGGGGGSAAGSGAAGGGADAGSAAGSAVAPIEDAPPSDMEGKDENPDAPHALTVEEHVEAKAPAIAKPAGYPIEEVLRPITLPQGMSEVSIGPHFQASPYAGSDALRARYGITRQVQLGLTYVMGGVYGCKQSEMCASQKYAFHPGKAFGLDVSVLLTNWLAVKVGVPVYIQPVAFSLAAGAPIKFSFGDKLALGGLDDVVNVTLSKFPPSFYQELYNAVGAFNETNNTEQSRGHIRIAGYAEYQQTRQVVFIGRLGVDSDLGGSGGTGAGTMTVGGGTATFIRAGLNYSPRRYLDVGGSLGFDDLSQSGSFGLAGFLALRI